MLILRIKQAETSLADGRLDEAYELVQDDQIREHRRGQQLIGSLAEALVERGCEHLNQKRFGEALSDCNKAEKLAGNLSSIAELRTAIMQAGNGRGYEQRQRSMKLAQAREHINKGWYSVGEQILDGAAGDGGSADILLELAATQRMEIEAIIKRVEDALTQDDLKTAVELILLTSQQVRQQNSKLTELVRKINSLAMGKIRGAVQQGRIDQGQSFLRLMRPLVSESLELQELERAVRQLTRAAELAESGQPRRAAQILIQLQAILPKAEWLERALRDLEQAAGSLEKLRTGPLGWIMPSRMESPELKENRESTFSSTIPGGKIMKDNRSEIKPMGMPAQTHLPWRFVIQIDGVGSFLVVRDNPATVGPVSSQQQPCIGLVTEPTTPIVTIERTDEDYFIRTPNPIHINNKPVKDKLLMDGDNISLSQRCQFKFQLPNAASTTARIAFTGTKYPRLDIRQAILLDREIIVGPGTSAHIRAQRSLEPWALYLQEGEMHCRTKEKIEIEGKTQEHNCPLPLEKPIKIGDISLVITRI